MKPEKSKPAKKAAKKVATKAVKKTAEASAKKAPAKKAAKKAPAKKAVKKAVKAPAKKATTVKKKKSEELLLDTPELILDTPEEAAIEEADEPEEMPAVEPQRLHKILAHAGVASRRKAEEMIVEGRVQVNGKVITELGAKASASDHIRVDGKLLQGPERQRYFMLNKPRGYVTTVSDPEGRPTVMEFAEKLGAGRLYPVGRLDYLSEGLLLLTNDGDLAHKLTKAASGVEKVYLVKVAGVPTDDEIAKLRSGVLIERGKIGTGGERVRTAPAAIQMVREGDNPWFEVVLIEGRNRELRKMFEEIGHHVEKIRRVGYGPLVLDVEPGKVRELEAKEVEDLRLTAEGKLKPKRQKLVLPKAKKPVPKSFEKFDKKVAGRKPAADFNATKDFEQGDRTFKPRREGDGERPAFRPKREGSFGGPRKEGGFKPQRTGGFGGPRREGGFGGPRREGKPAFGAGEKRFTPGDKPRFNREGSGDRPAFRPKREGEGDKPVFRPKREGGFGGPKREGGFSGPRREGSFGGPRKEGGFKPQRTGGFGGPRREGGFGGPRLGGRPPFGAGDKPFTPKPRFDADDKPAYNREKPAFRIEREVEGERPAFQPRREGSGDRPAFNRDKPAFRPKREGGFGGPRKEGGFGGPRKEGGFKPQRSGGFGGPKREGGFGGPRKEGGFGGPRAGGRPSFGAGDKPRFTPGDKPRFTPGDKPRFSPGDKPAFRPKRDGDFKPKREGGFGGPRKEGGSSASGGSAGWKPKKPFGGTGGSRGGGFGGPKKPGFGGGKKPFNRGGGGGRPPR
jgi:23S rRNA pseudouridine2605 synthase